MKQWTKTAFDNQSKSCSRRQEERAGQDSVYGRRTMRSAGQFETCGRWQMQSAVKRRSCDGRAMQNAGFSLLELIIAVSIFAIAAAILLQAFVTSSRINRKSGIYLDASTAAQNVMEEVKSKSFEEVALSKCGDRRRWHKKPHMRKLPHILCRK